MRKDKSLHLRVAIDGGVIIFVYYPLFHCLKLQKSKDEYKQSTERHDHEFKTCFEFLMSTFEYSCRDGERSSLDQLELAHQQLR